MNARRVHDARIDFDRPVVVQVDGEILDRQARHLAISIVPGALRIRA